MVAANQFRGVESTSDEGENLSVEAERWLKLCSELREVFRAEQICHQFGESYRIFHINFHLHAPSAEC